MSNDTTFTCLTCSETYGKDSISKHLSTTRHKNVRINELDETIECEQCEDSNIHQLSILRYGFTDMSLLCQQCSEKEKTENNETPSATYTLSNGAFFLKLDQYLKFRDLECMNCHSDENLFVGNDKNRTQYVACKACMISYDVNFVGEDDDTFLSVLLGIKEVPKNLKRSNRGRKGKFGKEKKGDKRGRRERRPDPEAEERRAHYMATKELASSIKSGTTVKAIGSAVIGKQAQKDHVSKFDNFSKGKGSPQGRKTPSRGSPAHSGRHTPVGKSPVNSGKSTPARSHTPVSEERAREEHKPRSNGKSEQGKRANDIPKPGKKTNDKPKEKQANKAKDKQANKSEQSKKSNEKVVKDKKSGDKPTTADQTPVNLDGWRNEEKPQNSAQGKKGRGNDKRENTKPKKSSGKSTPSRSQTPVLNDEQKQGKERSQTHVVIDGCGDEENKSLKSKEPPKKSKSKKGKESAKSPEPSSSRKNNIPNGNELVLPPSITKYNPASKPKLTYDSLHEYYREMSFNMFLEDQLTNISNIIESEYIMIEWYEDPNKRNTQYKLSVLSDSDIVNNFRSEIFKKLKKNPFSIGQSIFLILNDEIPWYGCISAVDEVSSKNVKRGRRTKKDVIEVVVTLYDWNNQPLPKTVHAQHLKVMPASVPVSRVLNAMDSLSNNNFIKMLLGKEPIRQIVFKNFLRYTRDTLNDSQKQAIQSIFNNAITVLQGPPGTGKTSTIFEIILQLLDSLNTYPILVVAPSNIAIDNIAEKLMPTHEKDLLRVVASEKEREYNKNHHLSSICLHHKIYEGLSTRSQTIVDEIKRGKPSVGTTGYKKFVQERFQVTKKMVAQAKVIFTTTVVAGSGQLKSISKCPVVIMDEATQSSEPTTLIPLSVPGVDKFVFVGDQKQLNCFSLVPGLSLSLFERVLLNGTYKTPHMLDTQYRMHPTISEFARNRFYGGLLKDGITAEDRKMEGIPENPVYFWNTNGKAHEKSVHNWLREDQGFTYTNPGEINYVIQVVKNLIIEKGIKREDIGIITPYSGQRDLISSILVKDDIINPQSEGLRIEVDIDDIKNDSKPVTIHIVSGILIASIDAFQGREKNFMVMSCVRSNVEGKIGFLRDERRLNVALTRAKYGMVIIGDEKCLRSGDKLWNSYMDHLKDKNSIHSSDTFIY